MTKPSEATHHVPPPRPKYAALQDALFTQRRAQEETLRAATALGLVKTMSKVELMARTTTELINLIITKNESALIGELLERGNLEAAEKVALAAGHVAGPEMPQNVIGGLRTRSIGDLQRIRDCYASGEYQANSDQNRDDLIEMLDGEIARRATDKMATQMLRNPGRTLPESDDERLGRLRRELKDKADFQQMIDGANGRPLVEGWSFDEAVERISLASVQTLDVLLDNAEHMQAGQASTSTTAKYVAAIKAELMLREPKSHALYTSSHRYKPAAICDSNGDVVLGQCRVCGRAEIELDEPCGPRGEAAT